MEKQAPQFYYRIVFLIAFEYHIFHDFFCQHFHDLGLIYPASSAIVEIVAT